MGILSVKMWIYKPKEFRVSSQSVTDNFCDLGPVPCPSCIPFCCLLSAGCCEICLIPLKDWGTLDCKYNKHAEKE